MIDKMTPKDFMAKCVWEGGLLETGFQYGLRASDLDDSDKTFKDMVESAEAFYLNFEREADKIYEKYGFFEEQEEDED